MFLLVAQCIYIPNEVKFNLHPFTKIRTISAETINMELSMCRGPYLSFLFEERTEQKIVLFIPEIKNDYWKD